MKILRANMKQTEVLRMRLCCNMLLSPLCSVTHHTILCGKEFLVWMLLIGY